MKRFGSRRKNFNIPSPKARRPVLNSNALPHTNRLASSPCFAEIFEEYEAESDALEDDDRCQRPTPVTRRKQTHSTPSVSHPTHVLVRQSSPPPQLLQAPIVATSQVDIDESLLKSNKKRISRRQSDLISVTNAVGTGHSSSGSTSSSTKSRATSPSPRAPAPHSDRRRSAMPDLQKRKKSIRRFMDTGE